MKSPIKIALLAALAIEAANFFLYPHLAPPIDVDLPLNTPWYLKLVALQWMVLHAVGIFATDWIDHIGFPGHDRLVIFIGGYFTTILLLIAGISGVRWFCRLSRRYSPDANPAATEIGKNITTSPHH